MMGVGFFDAGEDGAADDDRAQRDHRRIFHSLQREQPAQGEDTEDAQQPYEAEEAPVLPGLRGAPALIYARGGACAVGRYKMLGKGCFEDTATRAKERNVVHAGAIKLSISHIVSRHS